MIGLGLALQSVRSAALPPPPLAATLPVIPAARWHPQVSAVTESGGRVVTASDLMGLAGLTDNGAGSGPLALTDALGRKFWRFDGAQFLNVAASLATDNRNASVFCVGRVHRPVSGNPMFWAGNLAQGSHLSGGGLMDVATAASSAGFLRCCGRAGSLDAVNAPFMIPGAQLQVMGAVSRTTANGGTSLWINAARAAVGQNTVSRPVLTGGEIGRNPTATTQFGMFDLYEMIVCTTALTDAEGDAMQAALVAHYAIPAVTNQLVLEGDSITQGTGDVVSGLSCAMVLTEPGAGLIPANWRVLNHGTSGSQVSNLVTRRDATNGWPAMRLAGQNVMAFEIGRNDFVAGGQTAATHYANVVAYLNTAATGILQRGWTVRTMANIASSDNTRVDAYRALIRDPQFLTDTLSNTGQAHDGKVSIVDTDLITDGGQTIFATPADAADTTYYAGDSTHPNILGARLRVTGGDDPAKGVARGLG